MDSLLLLYIASPVLFTPVSLLDLALRRCHAPRASHTNADLGFEAQHTAPPSRPPSLTLLSRPSFAILRGSHDDVLLVHE